MIVSTQSSGGNLLNYGRSGIIQYKSLYTCCEIAIMWMPQNLTKHKPALAWLFACQLVVVSEEAITWAYGGTRPQLVRHVDYSYHTHSHCTHFFNNEMYSGWICAHWFTKDREKMAATLQTMFSVAPMLLNFDSKFIDICSYGSNWQWINIGLDGLVPIRRQAIIWTNNG